jgi:HTH-type transcriptional regulator / antitoxin HigA
MVTVTVPVIQNEADLKEALARLKEIFHAPVGSIEREEAEILGFLIQKAEKELYREDMESTLPPVDLIKDRMKDMNLKQKDLIEAIGDKSRVSEVLRGNRKLTGSMALKLSRLLHIPIELLLVP